MVKRKRGGQLGNLNALKHGFYSRQFKKMELDDLELLKEGLDDEIIMMRVITRRFMEAAADFEDGPNDPKEMRDVLGALGLAATRLASLLKTNKVLMGDRGRSEAISIALDEVMEEWNLS